MDSLQRSFCKNLVNEAPSISLNKKILLKVLSKWLHIKLLNTFGINKEVWNFHFYFLMHLWGFIVSSVSFVTWSFVFVAWIVEEILIFVEVWFCLVTNQRWSNIPTEVGNFWFLASALAPRGLFFVSHFCSRSRCFFLLSFATLPYCFKFNTDFKLKLLSFCQLPLPLSSFDSYSFSIRFVFAFTDYKITNYREKQRKAKSIPCSSSGFERKATSRTLWKCRVPVSADR